MRLLSRDELLGMDEETLLATAECHGLEIEGRTANEVIDELADFLADFAVMFGPEDS
jgi:hypothetical protein